MNLVSEVAVALAACLCQTITDSDRPDVCFCGVIPGEVADLSNPPPGCRFTPRCPLAFEACVTVPALEPAGPGHTVACWAASRTASEASPASAGAAA